MKKFFFALCLVSGFSFAQQLDLSVINDALLAEGMSVQISKLEYMVDPNAGFDAQGNTVFADHRFHRLSSQWVNSDQRRFADGDNLTYLSDPYFAYANSSIDSEPIVDSSFDTWNLETCSNMTLVKRPYTGGNPNFVLGLIFGFPANPFMADITTTGFLPGWVFDIIAPNGSQYILGVTFTLVFIDGNGNPTDVNNDGYTDTALKEVWYNDNFLWSDGSAPGVDLFTVALHENGHALGMAHFGKIFRNNGGLHIATRAVMNAAYMGPLPAPQATDKATMCMIYGNWAR